MATKKAAPAAKKAAAKKKAAPAKKKAPAKKAAKKAARAPTRLGGPAPSTKPLFVRLGVKAQVLHVVNPPEGFELEIPVEQIGFVLPEKLGAGDAVLAFAKNRAGVDGLAKTLKKALTKQETLLWVAYPKGAKGDLTRDKGWDALSALGYLGVAIVAVDDSWSALRLRHTSVTTRKG